MTNHRSFPSLGALAVAPALVLAALSGGCDTREIDVNRLVLTNQPGPDQAALSFTAVPDFATVEEEQADLAAGRDDQRLWLQIDGQQVVVADQPVSSLGSTETFRMPAGTHTFDVVDAHRRVVRHAGPYEVTIGVVSHLVVFGPREAKQDHFFSAALEVSPHMLHYTVGNLMRNNVPIEVVTCPDATPGSCTSVSSPLGYGDFAQGDAPLEAPGPTNSFTSNGLAPRTYYRMVPTAAVPAPFTNFIDVDNAAAWASRPSATPPIFFGGPIFMDPASGGVVTGI